MQVSHGSKNKGHTSSSVKMKAININWDGVHGSHDGSVYGLKGRVRLLAAAGQFFFPTVYRAHASNMTSNRFSMFAAPRT
jgi:hypothetical protein